jgi:succinate dehydrogenase / fumarate reductase membrane anchor subunit
MTLQSGIGREARARGSGPARLGLQAWTAQRVSALALVPLMLWLVAAVIMMHPGHAAFVAWLRRPLSSLLMVLSLIAIFHHTALGLQVILEDYVHSTAKVPLIIAARLGCFALCVLGVLSTLRVMLMR